MENNEFIVLEKRILNELKIKASNYLVEGEYDTFSYHKGMAIIECIEYIKGNTHTMDKEVKINQ
jgi:hypothetical protein